MSRRALLPALLVLALAAVLRLHGLPRWSLDGDELYSHYDVLELQEGTLHDGLRSFPLGYLLMAASTSLLGTDEVGLRAASAACGVLAVAALLFLRRDAVAEPVALTAGLLAALSPWLVYHAQEARFYAPLLLFATLGTLWALPGAGQRPALAMLCGLLAAACHPSALLLLPCLVAPALRRWLPARGVALLCVAAAVTGGAWLLLGRGTLPRLVQAAIERDVPARYDLVHFVAGFGYALGPGTLLLVLAGAVAALRRPAGGDRILLACALVPPALLLLISALAGAAQQRYAMAAAPALLLLAGRGVQALAGRRALRAALLGAALLLPVPQLLAYSRDGDRADMRAAAQWLAERARPDDVIVADEHALLELYLQRLPGWERVECNEESLRADQLASVPRAKADAWLVLKRNRMDGAYPAAFMEWVARHFEEQAVLGTAPPPFVRHDNRLVVLRRRGQERP